MSDSQTFVNVSNISNEATDEEIKQYLSLVGPVKTCTLNKNGCKLSAKVSYYDMETAVMAVNFLGETDFRGRDLKINLLDMDRNRSSRLTCDEQIYEDLIKLSPEEKLKVAHLAAQFYKAEGHEFAQFLMNHERIQEGLGGILQMKRPPHQGSIYNPYH